VQERPLHRRRRIARWLAGTAAGLALAVLAAPAQPADLIKPKNAGPGRVGVLVDGQRAGQFVNDRAYVEVTLGALFNVFGPLVALDDYVSASQNNEIIAFSRSRPPRLFPGIAWSPGTDKIEIEFEDEYEIPFAVWIVYGDFETQKMLAADHAVQAAQIWTDERQGVAVSEFEPVDATGNPLAGIHQDFTCGSQSTQIKNDIGFVPGRINIYYVDRVQVLGSYGKGNGVWCGSGVIAMGSSTGGGLLAHEIGHAFILQHTNTGALEPFFDNRNVMHPSSSLREFLSEGQTFVAVHNPSSDLNDNYTVRVGQPENSCNHSVDTTLPLCPAIQKRIWADGSLPPN
jgi:hypothetical protein